jgi:glycosyltransferase involved in cell wall biosynthesis
MLNPADVTTLIPVYNTDPKYLDRSINSILNCGYNLILIDDHSDNEDTIDLLYGNYNKYVIKSKSIQSQSGALYTGAELINTKYAMTIDSDDYITGSVDPQSDEEFDVCFTNGFNI